MKTTTLSRRSFLSAGACGLVVTACLPGSASAAQPTDGNAANEDLVRRWYAAWVNKDLATFLALMADDFTFSSAAGDDHLSKTKFKTQCWDHQAQLIDRMDLERISSGPEDVFVKYLGHTKNGATFRNVEYLRIANGKLESIECYFGAEGSFPSAANAKQKG